MVKAIGLFSGGLDSLLACCVLREQGIDVFPLTFTTPFFGAEIAKKAAKDLNLPIEVLDITQEHLVMLKDPPSGYGKYMNPCIDCHSLMMAIAGKRMDEEGYDFIFTGEVLGERPMSQNRGSLNRVVNRSGYKGYILRPLSALLLEETIPEQEGKVDRSRLLDISGRSRSRQFELAKQYEIHEYPSPAGGCRLTDPIYSGRLKDLFNHFPDPPLSWIYSLALGRHFWLDEKTKAVVGRNEKENDKLDAFAIPEGAFLTPKDFPGPTVLVFGEASDSNLALAASLVTRYGSKRDKKCSVLVNIPGKDEYCLEAVAMESTVLESLRVVV